MIIKLASYNCKGFKYRNYPYINKLFNKCDIVLLQEHWLFQNEFCVINKIVPNAEYCFVSAMNDDVILNGRPYGGVGVLYRKKNNLSIKPIISQSKRICAFQCHFAEVKFIIFSVYMPCNASGNLEEFTDVLSETVSLCNVYSDHGIIVGGDFNTTLDNNNLRGECFIDFLTLLDLICPTAFKSETSYSFLNSQGDRSLIDHFCVSSGILKSIIDFQILSDGDNLSDHMPIVMSIELQTNNKINTNCNNESKNFSTFDWCNASDLDIHMYQYYLNNNLSNINIPINAVKCSNFHCSNHYNDFCNLYNDIVFACLQATNKSIAVRNSRSLNNKVFGWNKFVKPVRNKAIFWHKVWKESDSPSSGVVHDIRKRTRAKYHNELKQLKNKQETLIKNKLTDSILNSKNKDFWKSVKKVKGNVSSTPDTIDGISGDNICNVFKEKYIKLYQTESCSALDQVLIENDQRISCFCNSNNKTCKHLHCIYLNQIKSAVRKLKNNNKECDSLLVTNCLKNGTDMLFLYISFLFTIMIRHGFSNSTFNTVVFNPLVKNERKCKSDSDNYRAIALNSMFSKLLDYIILEFFNQELLSSDYQFAYKKNFSTTMCSFLLKDTVEYYINNGNNVYATFLDCSKAFDCVRHDILFDILMEKGICPLIIRLLIVLYKNMMGTVKWNNNFSEKFSVFNGVKQGGVLSPALFTLYIDELIKLIHKSKVGCYVGDLPASVFIYADDIVLLSPTRYSMKVLLDICEKFGRKYGLNFNPNKTECMFFSKFKNEKMPENFYLNSIPIKFVSSFTHLGHLFSSGTCSFSADQIVKDIKSKSNCIVNFFNFAAVHTKAKLFNYFCTSYYGSVLCDINELEQIDVVWRTCARRVINVHPRTRSYLLPGLLCSLNARNEIEKRILIFFRDGLNHDSTVIKSFFYNCIFNQSSKMSYNIRFLSRQNNIDIFNEKSNSRGLIKKLFFRKIRQDWRVDAVGELLRIRDGDLQLEGFSGSVLSCFLTYLCAF